MKKGHGDSSREKKKKVVICIEVSRTHTAMDVRESKAIMMTKKLFGICREEGAEVGLQRRAAE